MGLFIRKRDGLANITRINDNPRAQKDLDRYKDLLSQWFSEEPTLDYDNLAVNEAEQALVDLMKATVTIGLQRPS